MVKLEIGSPFCGPHTGLPFRFQPGPFFALRRQLPCKSASTASLALSSSFVAAPMMSKVSRAFSHCFFCCLLFFARRVEEVYASNGALAALMVLVRAGNRLHRLDRGGFHFTKACLLAEITGALLRLRPKRVALEVRTQNVPAPPRAAC